MSPTERSLLVARFGGEAKLINVTIKAPRICVRDREVGVQLDGLLQEANCIGGAVCILNFRSHAERLKSLQGMCRIFFQPLAMLPYGHEGFVRFHISTSSLGCIFE